MLYTVTLNPTIDRSLTLSGNLIPGGLNRASLSGICAGGKGINCARAASSIGAATAAYTVIGRENISEFEKSTEQLSLEVRAEMKSGVTRTCVKLYNPNGMVTECNEGGSKLTASEMRDLMSRLLSDMKKEGKPSYIILSGSLPAGTESGVYADMIALFSKLGVPALLDCDGDALRKGIAARPYLVKPNLSELEELVGKELDSLSDIADAANALAKQYGTRVLATVGGDGMIYADGETVLQVKVPDLKVSTTVGAGDTVLGVFAACLERGLETEKALQLAAAAACAKVTSLPGKYPTKKEALAFLSEISVVPFALSKKTLEEAPEAEEEESFEEILSFEEQPQSEEEILPQNEEEIVISEK